MSLQSVDKVVVTGASGFVGETLSRRLVDRGVAVVGTGQSHPVRVVGVESVQLDLSDPGLAKKLFAEHRPSAVIHCAAMTDVARCQRDPQMARRCIVDATSRIADAVAEIVPQAPVIGLSTDLVFDGEHAPYTETDPPGPISVYGQAKLDAEDPILGLDRGMVLRTSLVYGPATTYRTSFLDWIVGALNDGKTLSLFEDEVRTPIYVVDLCDAIIEMLSIGHPGIWHVAGPQRVSRAEMGHAVCSVYGYDRGLIHPQKLADSSYPAPRPRDVSLDSTKLWGLLGKQAMGFVDGLRAMIKDTP